MCNNNLYFSLWPKAVKCIHCKRIQCKHASCYSTAFPYMSKTWHVCLSQNQWKCHNKNDSMKEETVRENSNEATQTLLELRACNNTALFFLQAQSDKSIYYKGIKTCHNRRVSRYCTWEHKRGNSAILMKQLHHMSNCSDATDLTTDFLFVCFVYDQTWYAFVTKA